MKRAAALDVELARFFDRQGPRYTSYPTAVEFHSGVDGSTYAERLAQADAQEAGQP
jgi:oxygen-independent coproporphyrinogen-3 oxidase